MKFRFHVISLPHTQTTKEYTACAYTMKVVKFCQMMKSLGHDVFLYASEENEAPCDELITIVTKAEQRAWFGEYDFGQQFFNIDWDPAKPCWVIPNTRAIAEISKRAKAKDFVCIIGGVCQKQISDGLPDLMSVEYGIGYTGVYSKFRVYESYAHMHYVHGVLNEDDGRFFDAVIPNYFDPADFPYRAKKDDFFLYVGRMIQRKGLEVAVEVTRQIGAKLVLAGQGVNKIEGNKIIADELTIEGDHIKHMGHANVKQRGELMSRAKAVFLCTYYLEPFGGTSIEPLFCGTPVITTDWGAFPENIPHGLVGYRTRTLGEAVWAAQNVDKLNPAKIRKYAIDNFSMERVKYQYQAYFEQLNTLWDENGWYSNWHRGVSKYERYSKYYPK
jgi:glycosyltransferase involved in cell wall biosynthesis